MIMQPQYEFDFAEPAASAVGGVAGFMLVFMLLFYLLMLGWSVLSYVLYSLSLYKIARRRGIHQPWLAWLPVGNVWVLGSISDQYQYVAKGRVRNRRKVLTGLSIGMFATVIVLLVAVVMMALGEAAAADATEVVFGAMLAIVVLAYIAMIVLAIVMLVFEYMALYDLFASCDPGNATLYLVLSILLGVVLPFFLFACRNKDLGMPPKKVVQPVYTPVEPPAAPACVPEETPVAEPAVESAPVAESTEEPAPVVETATESAELPVRDEE